jgi:hypothetical protein
MGIGQLNWYNYYINVKYMTATVSFEARKTALVNLKPTFGKRGA